MPDITRILDIAAPPSRVWAQFAEPAGMRSWLADDLDIDLQRGGEGGHALLRRGNSAAPWAARWRARR